MQCHFIVSQSAREFPAPDIDPMPSRTEPKKEQPGAIWQVDPPPGTLQARQSGAKVTTRLEPSRHLTAAQQRASVLFSSSHPTADILSNLTLQTHDPLPLLSQVCSLIQAMAKFLTLSMFPPQDICVSGLHISPLPLAQRASPPILHQPAGSAPWAPNSCPLSLTPPQLPPPTASFASSTPPFLTISSSSFYSSKPPRSWGVHTCSCLV